MNVRRAGMCSHSISEPEVSDRDLLGVHEKTLNCWVKITSEDDSGFQTNTMRAARLTGV